MDENGVRKNSPLDTLPHPPKALKLSNITLSNIFLSPSPPLQSVKEEPTSTSDTNKMYPDLKQSYCTGSAAGFTSGGLLSLPPYLGMTERLLSLQSTLSTQSLAQQIISNYCLSHCRQSVPQLTTPTATNPNNISTSDGGDSRRQSTSSDAGLPLPISVPELKQPKDVDLTSTLASALTHSPEVKTEVDEDSRRNKKSTRRTFTDEQVAKLETYFDYKRYFTPAERAEIAKELKLTETQIKTWFQNRRAKNKRDENEKREQEQLRIRQIAARDNIAKLMRLGGIPYSGAPYPTSLFTNTTSSTHSPTPTNPASSLTSKE